MSRSLIIIGNGLGMALDPNYFTLKKGLDEVWNKTHQLNDDKKGMIISAIEGTTSDSPPSSEDQLDTLQVALLSTEFLLEFENPGCPWVSSEARELPVAFRKFLHEVAMYFQSSHQNLPERFIDPLINYIEESKSHVATLNYDNLIYDSFCSNNILRGYDGSLIDGYWNSAGFSPYHLDRRSPQSLGWYLHLHGSPLFIDNHKATGAGRIFLEADNKCHIVLTHVKHKQLIIESSAILSEYWRRLDMALNEVDRIILFGYSGCDNHLNERLKLHNSKDIWVVEWNGTEDQDQRHQFWQDLLKVEKLDRFEYLDNILDFNDW